MDRRLIGNIGEEKVALFYKKAGYNLLATNFKTKFGEIDIICQKDKLLVFIEVKTRSSASFAKAYENVTYKKQQKIKSTAKIYISKYKFDDLFVRFDVAEVYKNENEYEINIIEDAFE